MDSEEIHDIEVWIHKLDSCLDESWLTEYLNEFNYYDFLEYVETKTPGNYQLLIKGELTEVGHNGPDGWEPEAEMTVLDTLFMELPKDWYDKYYPKRTNGD